MRFTPDTIFEGPLASGSDSAVATAPESIIGAHYSLYMDADGNFAPDKNIADGKYVVEIVDVEDVPLAYLPGNATRVRVKAVGELHVG